jgi:hypothetical protein
MRTLRPILVLSVAVAAAVGWLALTAGADAKPTRKPAQDTIEITSPKSNAEVELSEIVEGLIHLDGDLGDRYPMVLVHPMLTDSLWVQSEPTAVDTAPEGLSFRANVYLGTKEKGIGEKFELIAVLVKKGSLREGDRLGKVPSGVPVSRTVLVKRVKD